jgi:hypothetical protein
MSWKMTVSGKWFCAPINWTIKRFFPRSINLWSCRLRENVSSHMGWGYSFTLNLITSRQILNDQILLRWSFFLNAFLWMRLWRVNSSDRENHSSQSFQVHLCNFFQCVRSNVTVEMFKSIKFPLTSLTFMSTFSFCSRRNRLRYHYSTRLFCSWFCYSNFKFKNVFTNFYIKFKLCI